VTLTYGTIVAQLCKDYESDYVEVNKQLDKMGYNIGLRLIEDYLAKSNTMNRCSNFRETAEMISRVWSTSTSVYVNVTDSARLDSRSSSTSRLRLQIGQATASSSP
jgi:trafficking protein particle complex subunit 3